MKKEKKKVGFSLAPDLDRRVRTIREKGGAKTSQAAVFRGLIRLGLGQSPRGKQRRKALGIDLIL